MKLQKLLYQAYETWLEKARASIAILISVIYGVSVLSAIFIFQDSDLLIKLFDTDTLLGMVVVLLIGAQKNE